MANYVVDPLLLQPFLPYKTELDFWNGNCYVSLVGFLFRNTRLKGIPIPFHTTFEEVNLRFYVRYKTGKEWKRGVVFIKEIVPKPAITFVANRLYNEHYQTLPMRHSWTATSNEIKVVYSWKLNRWHSLSVTAKNIAQEIASGSEEEFITEHYWGYTKIGEQHTGEYEVAHPKWVGYEVTNYAVQADFGQLYGQQFEILNHMKPSSVLLAEGSEIMVRPGLKI